MKYSAIIPVYNSEALIGTTIDRLVAFFEGQGWEYEVVLINDGSRDDSWRILTEKAAHNDRIRIINFLRNYGQHTAIFCGLQNSTGDVVITLDDDLQNPPEEIIHLVEAMHTHNYDVVYGQFRGKKHAWYRRIGSIIIREVNRFVFERPPGLVLSNFRLIRREVVDRISAYQTNYPYITGLSLMFASNPGNAWVEHHERSVGASQYTLFRIMRLVMRILFNYSAWPLRVVSLGGMGIAGISFLLGVLYLVQRLLGRISVPGWTTVVVLLSFFNGVSLLILGMLGEYVVRLLREVSGGHAYHIKESINL